MQIAAWIIGAGVTCMWLHQWAERKFIRDSWRFIGLHQQLHKNDKPGDGSIDGPGMVSE